MLLVSLLMIRCVEFRLVVMRFIVAEPITRPRSKTRCYWSTQLIGSYLHGLFDHPDALNALLEWAGVVSDHAVDLEQIRQQQLDRLADTLEEHLVPEFIEALVSG